MILFLLLTVYKTLVIVENNVFVSVRLIDFLTCEVTVGMTYLCMDFFIKQYTKRIDFNQNLNPMLKGITYGILLQSALWTMLVSEILSQQYYCELVFVK